MRDMLSALFGQNIFSPLDISFAEFAAAEDPAHSDAVYVCAMLVSAHTARGNVCLAMDEPFFSDDQSVPLIELAEMSTLFDAVKTSPLFSGHTDTPFVIQGSRIYLSRYFEYEQTLSAHIKRRVRVVMNDYSEPVLIKTLQTLFPESRDDDWQKAAACTAVLKNFSVITGGPGTGKTTTVVKVMALLNECAAYEGKNLSIAIAAPTGKAAARLSESIKAFKNSPYNTLSSEMNKRIVEDASTIHRLLKVSYGQTFFYTEENKLPFDVVIIDEASMIDCALMSKCISAVRDDARIILLGDKEQLSSVEPGHVLGDICAGVCGETKSAAFAKTLLHLGGIKAKPSKENMLLADAVTVLSKSYRFNDAGGIGAVSAAVRAGDAARAFSAMKTKYEPTLFAMQDTLDGSVYWHDMHADTFASGGEFEQVVSPCYTDYFSSQCEQDWFERFARFRILSPLRTGVNSAEMLNIRVEQFLSKKMLIVRKPALRYYPGMPLMVTQNDYAQNLFNGDIGIALPDDKNGATLRAAFLRTDQSVRRVAPERIAGLESVYAMTVHKSQGSEFDTVVLVLPPVPAPVLTRELVYTALTRAKKCVHIFAKKDIFSAALDRTASRTSGLREELWDNACFQK